MPWITLSPSDLQPYLAAPQREVLTTAARGPGEDDPLPTLLQDAAQRIRLELTTIPGQVLSATAFAIPPELRTAALAFAIDYLHRRLPGFSLTDAQRRALTEAKSLLAKTTRGHLPLSPPQDPLPAARPAMPGVTPIHTTQNPLTRDRLRSLS